MRDEKDIAQEALQKLPLVFGMYEHYKGGLYIVYSSSVHEEDLLYLIHYYSIKNKTRWTRTMENFFSNVGDKPRFRYLRDVSELELKEAAGFKL